MAPVDAVLAPIEYCAPHLSFAAAAEDHIKSAVLFPHLGIPHIRCRRDNNPFAAEIVKRISVLRGYHELYGFIIFFTDMDVFRVDFLIADSRIIQVHPSVMFYGTAGEAAVLIFMPCGEKRHPHMFPVHKIFTDRMSPVHCSPHGRIGKILIKQMILSFVTDKPVGIVDPVSGRLQM